MNTPLPSPAVDLSADSNASAARLPFTRVAVPEAPVEPWPFAIRALLVLASVALFRAALPPVGFAPLALVATAPFLVALRGLTPRQALRVGFVHGYLSAAANAHWFVNVFDPGFAAGLWLLLALFPAAFACGYAALARRDGLAFAIVAPALWVALEWFRCEGWHLRFAWFTIAHALAGDSLLRQNADIAGAYGLSLFGFVVSFLIAQVVLSTRNSGKALVLGLFALSLPLVAYARGNRVVGFAPNAEATAALSSMSVLAIQDERTDQPSRKLALTRDAVAKDGRPDFVVWPEISFTTTDAEKRFAPDLASTAALARGAFIYGTVRPTPEKGREWNAAILLAPDGGSIGEYHKSVPVQFVEASVPGDEWRSFDVLGHKVGVLICYDGTYPFVARRIVQSGAELLLLPTWDASHWGPIQHAHHALFYSLRACELRRPILRAASSGITLAVDAWGRDIGHLAGMEPGTLRASLVPSTSLTPYARGGWLLPHACLAITAGAALVALGQRVRRAKA